MVVLGGGIAGLVSAYELGKLGYTGPLLEARERVGEELDRSQRNQGRFYRWFQPELRLPARAFIKTSDPPACPLYITHLGYCQELGVPLEVEINASRSAYLQSDPLNGGQTVQNRQVEYDTRGHVSNCWRSVSSAAHSTRN